MEFQKIFWPDPATIMKWDGTLDMATRVPPHIKWLDYGPCWVHVAPQKLPDGSTNPDWLAVRNGVASSTIISGLVGKGFGNCAESISFLKGATKVFTSPTSKKMLQHGLDNEFEARTKLEQGENISIHEVGFAISKLDPRIGCSADGLIYIMEDGKVKLTNEGVEIKCPPKGIYPKIISHKNLLETLVKSNMTNDTVFDPYYHEHISEQHYIQMQMCMFVYDMQEWRYVVYYKHTGEIFGDPNRYRPKERSEMYVETVKRNDTYIRRLMRALLPALDFYTPLPPPPEGLVDYVPLSEIMKIATLPVKKDPDVTENTDAVGAKMAALLGIKE